MANERAEQARQLWEAGRRTKDIAEITGLSEGYIRHVASRDAWAPRRPKSCRKARRGFTNVPKGPDYTVQAEMELFGTDHGRYTDEAWRRIAWRARELAGIPHDRKARRVAA